MADTKRTKSALQLLFADNTTEEISPQDLRDFLVSVMGALTITTVNVASYDLLDDDILLLVTRTATGTCQINLLTALTNAGRIVHIVDAGGNANANNITIATEGAQLISGQATQTILADYNSISLICDGSNWFIF